MTVDELIKKLEKEDKNLDVSFEWGNNYYIDIGEIEYDGLHDIIIKGTKGVKTFKDG